MTGGSAPTLDKEVEAATGGTDGSWRRDFGLLWGGSVSSRVGAFSVATAGPLLALALGKSPIFAGWVTAAATVPSLLLYMPAGVFVDRFDRRKIMFGSELVRLLVGLLLVAGLFMFRNPAPLLLVAAVTDGTACVFYSIAEMTAVRRVVPPGELVGAMGHNEARNHLALLLGRPLGGYLYAVGRAVPYAFNVLACLFSIAALWRMRTRDFQPARASASAPGEGSRAALARGLRVLLADSFLRTVVVVCAITNFFFQTVVMLLIVMAREQGLSGSLIGLLLATTGVGGLLGSLAAPRTLRLLQPKAILVVCVWGWLPLTVIVALVNDPVAGLLAWGALSFMGAHINVALAIHQAERVPEELMGRVASINSFLTSGALPLGALSAGYIIEALGAHQAAVLVAWVVAVLSVAVVPALAIDRIRPRAAPRRVRRPEPAPDAGS